MTFAGMLQIRTWIAGKHPRVLEHVSKVAASLGTTPDAMLSKSDRGVIEAMKKAVHTQRGRLKSL